MEKEYIIFDLDGTIINSEKGITESAKYALEHFQIYVDSQEELRKFIGPPLVDTLSNTYKLSDEEVVEAVKKYREKFNKSGVHANHLYEGIKDLIIDLYNNGNKLYIATTKPQIYSDEIIKGYGLDKYFIENAGSNLDGTNSSKIGRISHILENNNIKDLDKAIMIGDHRLDIEGANNCNIDSIAALYGFGDEKDIDRENPTHKVNSANEIRKILL